MADPGDGAGAEEHRSSPRPEAHPVSEAMRAIRRMRRMRAAEVAARMGMPVRSYEHMEAGTGRITYDRVVAFAEATDSDAIAILCTPPFGSSEFAVRCTDNKLMTIMMIAIMELHEDLGADLTYLDAQTLVGGFTRLARDLASHVRKRETFAEDWLRRGTDRLANEPGKRPRLARGR